MAVFTSLVDISIPEDIRVDHLPNIDVTERKQKKESVAGSGSSLWFPFREYLIHPRDIR
jgi:hypothetical protein